MKVSLSIGGWGALRADGRTEAFQGFRSGYKLLPSVKMFVADGLADLSPAGVSRSNLI